MRLATDSAPDGCPASIADIRFVFNKALPTPEGRVVLKALPARLKQGSAVQVRGYTDDQGSGRLNRSLAAKRAAYVARWLNKHGIRVSSQSAHGLCCYLSPESSRQARQINRRVEIEF